MIETSVINTVCKDFDIPFRVYNFEHFRQVFPQYKNTFSADNEELKKINMVESIVDLLVSADNDLSNYRKSSGFLFKAIGDVMAFMWRSMKGENDETVKPFYDEFNTCDMNKLFPLEKLNIPNGDVYNFENVSKSYISVDMSKAAFQAFRFAKPEIVYNTQSWTDYVDLIVDKFVADAKKNEDNPCHEDADLFDEMFVKWFIFKYIENSRNIRQVVFGKTNGGRLCHIEKYIMQEKVYKPIMEKFPYAKPVKLCNDEIIFDYDTQLLHDLQDYFAEVKDFDFKVEAFKIGGMKIYQVDTDAAEYLYDWDNRFSGKYSVGVGNVIVRRRIDRSNSFSFKCCPARLRYFANLFMSGRTVIDTSHINPMFTKIDANGLSGYMSGELAVEKILCV